MTITVLETQAANMTGLNKADRDIWSRATKDVNPLGQPRVGPVGGHQFAKVAEPRAVEYHPAVDLHGLTIQEAYLVVRDHIENGALLGYKRLTIVSGKSGQINQELPRWAGQISAVRSVTPMNGGGAWEICLKRRDT